LSKHVAGRKVLTLPEAPVNTLPKIWNQFACLDFIDSEFADHTGSGRRFDRLPLQEWQRAFLDRWSWRAPVPAPPAQLRLLRELRSRLRHLLVRAPAGRELDPNDTDYLNRNLALTPFVFKVQSHDGLKLVPVRRNWQWIRSELVRSAVQIITELDLRRLKVCANPDCSWLFYDESMNRTRLWCQANYCGNLLKVRDFRARHPH
jgi:predicted RNA-binding Zn ribbon-like protein